MKNFLSVCSLLFFGAFALAAPIKVEVPKISTVPKVIRATMPKKAETEFFGKMPEGFTKGKIVWLHFYSVQSDRKAPAKAKRPFNPNDYFLDLWQQKTASSSFQRLCSTKLNGSEFVNSPLFRAQNFISIEADAM